MTLKSRVLSGVAAFLWTCLASAAPAVLQRGNDANVSGANLSETVLNTSNVSANGFGLQRTLPVDDNIMAQPLYVPGVAVPGRGTRNLLLVATMSDSLYAFDADVGSGSLWHINLATLVGGTPVPVSKFLFKSSKSLIHNLGILSTPVIDPATNVMYVVACALENGAMVYRLHAVNILTGAEPYGPGVVIAGSYLGSTFEARYQTQRVSLVLSHGKVVFGFGALEQESAGAYNGWVMAYDELSLAQTGIFATVTTGNLGAGVWQAGRPPAVDASGYVYVFSGNAYGGGYDGIGNFSESVLKLDPANGLALVDWFTPGNWSLLDTKDSDLTSSGPMLIPGTTLLAGGGKNGELYLLDTTNLGHYDPNDAQVVQVESIALVGIRGGPVYWDRPAASGGPVLYNWGMLDQVKAFPFSGTVAASPSSQGTAAPALYPGGILALSANGAQAGSGILWANIVASGDLGQNPPAPGALVAFDANNVATQLWSSTTNPTRDNFGNVAKFVPPTIANGRVYMATWSKQVAVYGLLTAPVSLTAAANVGGIFTDGMVESSTGLNGAGLAYSAHALSPALTRNGVLFKFGPPDVLDAVSNATVTLPAGNFSTLRLMATSVNGPSTAQPFTVTYTDGTTAVSTVSLSDWCTQQHYPGESLAKGMTVEDTNTGQTVQTCASVNLYGYTLTLDPTRTVQSLTLPANPQVVLLAATLVN